MATTAPRSAPRPTIRLARPDDADAIARIETATWRDAYPNLIPTETLVTGRGTPRHWRRRLDGRDRNVLVGEAAAAGIVGYATWGPVDAPDHAPGGRAAQLFELYVHMDHREIGLGRRLCAEVARRSARAGAAQLFVEVLDGNPARFFYEAMGARAVARAVHPFAGKPLPTVIYVWRDLSALSARETA